MNAPAASNTPDLRVGTGFDSHRLAAGRPLILGGVEIPAEFGLDGHSDADVLTHAVIDAILGAAALGDIGSHFPDSDERYRGARSIDLLKQVVKLLTDAGFQVSNIDATVILEQPRIGEYREQIRETLGDALGLAVDRVSIKATSGERIGFVGRGEGAAASATALIRPASG